jgi:hypothetical protein
MNSLHRHRGGRNRQGVQKNQQQRHLVNKEEEEEEERE